MNISKGIILQNVGGENIAYSSDFIKKHSVEQIIGVVIHWATTNCKGDALQTFEQYGLTENEMTQLKYLSNTVKRHFNPKDRITGSLETRNAYDKALIAANQIIEDSNIRGRLLKLKNTI